MEYGLIGSKLGHSYSKIIHEMLCGYRYDLCPLPTEEEARAFLTRRQFKAINVTIPYKRLVMEYCTYIDPRAKAIGAVNTVVNKNGLLYGYNTDYLGVAHLCVDHGVDFAFETTLATRSYASLIRTAQSKGYYVSLVYFWLNSPELAVGRVQMRVEAGGHNIDQKVVRRRYRSGIKNLFDIYIPVCDYWILLDNSRPPSKVIAKGNRDKTKSIVETLIYKTLKNYE